MQSVPKVIWITIPQGEKEKKRKKKSYREVTNPRSKNRYICRNAKYHLINIISCNKIFFTFFFFLTQNKKKKKKKKKKKLYSSLSQEYSYAVIGTAFFSNLTGTLFFFFFFFF